MRTLKLILAYDGTRFVGWQRQAQGTSIQGLLEEALARLEGAPVTVHGAGRTDAGVHALGQVASIRVACAHDTGTLQRALNAQLPEDVRVTGVEEMASDFHARFGARSKTYRYLIRHARTANPFERAYAWHLSDPLDLAAMREAAGVLVGTHDFAAFRSAGTDVSTTLRTVTHSTLMVVPDAGLLVPMESEPASCLLAYEVAGNGFLRHMVRAIVGTLVDVGLGRRTPGEVRALLTDASRSDAGATAPAQGLFLVRVDYH